MKSYTFLVFLLLAYYPLPAQWNKVEAITLTVHSLLFYDENIFAGTDSLLFISRDKGLSWQSIYLNGQHQQVKSLFFVENKIFAGTYGNGVYISTDNGYSWFLFNSGLTGFALYASDFALSGDTLFYGSDGGGVYFLKLNSNTWQSYNQNLPSNYAWTVNDIAVTNKNILLSSGASGFYYLRPKGSSQWIEKSIISPGGIASTPNTFIALGDTVFAGSRAGIFRSLDNGSTWDSVGISAMQMSVVTFTEYNKKIFAGYTRFSGGDFYTWYTDDYGITWNFSDHEFHYLKSLQIYDDKMWAATADGLYYKILTPLSVEPVEPVNEFILEQNYPNPFNPVTKIRYEIPGQARNDIYVQLKVYDVLGNEVAILVDEYKSAGNYEVNFSTEAIRGIAPTSGIYFYTLTAGDYKQTIKMVLLK